MGRIENQEFPPTLCKSARGIDGGTGFREGYFSGLICEQMFDMRDLGQMLGRRCRFGYLQ